SAPTGAEGDRRDAGRRRSRPDLRPDLGGTGDGAERPRTARRRARVPVAGGSPRSGGPVLAVPARHVARTGGLRRSPRAVRASAATEAGLRSAAVAAGTAADAAGDARALRAGPRRSRAAGAGKSLRPVGAGTLGTAAGGPTAGRRGIRSGRRPGGLVAAAGA